MIKHTPIEKTIPPIEPSFKLILAAVMLSNPGGITPTKAMIKPRKKTKVIFKLLYFKPNIRNWFVLF